MSTPRRSARLAKARSQARSHDSDSESRSDDSDSDSESPPPSHADLLRPLRDIMDAYAVAPHGKKNEFIIKLFQWCITHFSLVQCVPKLKETITGKINEFQPLITSFIEKTDVLFEEALADHGTLQRRREAREALPKYIQYQQVNMLFETLNQM